MSRRMSVSMTLDAVRARQKTVTRRHVDTWKNLIPGDRLTLIEKGMGLPKGAKQVVVCEVEIVDVRIEALSEVTRDEVVREGLIDAVPVDRAPGPWFREFWARGHGYADRINRYDDLIDIPCRRIEWRYLPAASGDTQ